jgi:4-hydroxythreonine-4-phosphate dehydrogenase
MKFQLDKPKKQAKPEKPAREPRPLLGITMGDPAGIGPEVIAKALAGKALRRLCHPIVIGSVPVMEQTIKSLKLKLNVVRVEGYDPKPPRAREIAVLDPLDHPLGRFPRGVASPETGAASVLFIKKAVELAQLGCIDGVVTAPINKEAINMAGCHFPGHTELLADLTKTEESGMMIIGGPLRIMFVTTHVAIKDLPTLLTQAKIEKAIRLAHLALRDLMPENMDCSETKRRGSFSLRLARHRPRAFVPAIPYRPIPCSARRLGGITTVWWRCTTIRGSFP